MNRIPRVVVGSAPVVPGGHARLAFRLAEHGSVRGLKLLKVTGSRIRRSSSRYLLFRDRWGRDWHIRVSEHYCPRRTGHIAPHFDLVSLDGTSGFEAGAEYIDRIARGEIAWSEPRCTPRKRVRR